jgi:hypothetical protein
MIWPFLMSYNFKGSFNILIIAFDAVLYKINHVNLIILLS